MLFLFLILSTASLSAYKLRYAEEYYRLIHRHLYMYETNIEYNIFVLEQALDAPFANQLNAMATITNLKENEWYQNLFRMQVNLLIIDQYRLWASKYEKRKAYFYNFLYDQNMESLEIAKSLYVTAGYYWEQAQVWAEKAAPLAYLDLDEIHYWQDQRFRIAAGDLDYGEILRGDIERVEATYADFASLKAQMERNGYISQDP